MRNNRLHFIRKATAAIGGLAITAALPPAVLANVKSERLFVHDEKPIHPPRLNVAVIGINHGHISSLVDTVTRGGGTLISFYAKEPELAADFAKKFPHAKLVRSEKEIYEDKSIQLIVSAAIPDQRALIGIAAMQHGKDFLADKPGITSLEQLTRVKKVQRQTGRIYAILYGRLENRATQKAGELVKAGAIGKVIQTMAVAPHRVNPKTRPDWFWNVKRYGGIINDIGSHQFDEFLFFTGCTKADIVASQVANINHAQYPLFQDFGDAMVTGDQGTGYLRLDWFTPDGLKSWGDNRITILGTEGYIEIRKILDIGGREGGNHVFLVDNKEIRHFDCNNMPLTFGKLFVDDLLNRTETSMQQERCFLATELALKAQQEAKVIHVGTHP
jgi:predicted dehydrogenase